MPTTDRIRVVQVGCGSRAPAQIEAALACGAVDLVAVCDRHPEKVAAIGERYNIPGRYTDLQEMIRVEQPELVNIVTRPQIRTALVDEAVAAGAPALLIEKPISLTPSETRYLVELGQERLIAVNTQYQWMPHWQSFWPILRDGGLGTIRLLRASTRMNVLEQGPHVLDLALKAVALSGLPGPEWVFAACTGTEYFGDVPVPADTSATIGFGEARLHFNAGPSAPEVPGEKVPHYHIQVEVIGDRGRLWVSLNQGWRLWRDGAIEEGKTGWPQNDGESQQGLFVDLRDTLHGATDAWHAFPTRVAVAGQVADIFFGCYASALGGGRVSLGRAWPDTLVSELAQLAAGSRDH